MTALLRGGEPAAAAAAAADPDRPHSARARRSAAATAKKPILYVGQGANEAPAAGAAAARRARRRRPPEAPTGARGRCPEAARRRRCTRWAFLDEHHPQSMHMLGMHGAAYANFAIQESDLIVAIGSRFDDRTTGDPEQVRARGAPRARGGAGGFVHFDIEPSQFGRVIDPTVAVAGDCKDALKQLLPLVKAARAAARRATAGCQRCAELKASRTPSPQAAPPTASSRRSRPSRRSTTASSRRSTTSSVARASATTR